MRSMVKARFFRNPDAPLLPQHVPVDEIAHWLLDLIKRHDGTLQHGIAALMLGVKYATCKDCAFNAPLYDERGERMYDRRRRHRTVLRIHPDILYALWKLTGRGRDIIWEKDVRGWRAKPAAVGEPSLPPESDRGLDEWRTDPTIASNSPKAEARRQPLLADARARADHEALLQRLRADARARGLEPDAKT
jgi:hypothetical protein